MSLDSKLKELGVKQIGKEAMGVCEYRLPNGLKILLAPNHSAPVVTYMQLFRVGSRNEGVGNTGATHFLEHMMFKGTAKFDPAKGLDSTELFNRIGAVSNATTWFDRTNYFEAVPAEYLEFCIKVEADRMRNLQLRQSDRDAEMSVVRNELERGENSPDEALDKEMYAIAFREHPYHHPTIGWRSDVENVPMERLKEFYDTFYWPDNCTVIITGDFEPQATLRLLHKYYAKIRSAPKPLLDIYTVEPAQEGERRYQISRSGDLPRIWIGYHTPASTHADHYALNVISHVLGGSHDRSSRLYQVLVDSGLAMEAFCRHDELRDPALLILGAVLNPGVKLADVEAVLLAELDKLVHEAVSLAELAPIKSANRKGSILARADQLELAFALGESEARADWRWLVDFDANFEAVTPQDIMRVAAKYFVSDNRTVGQFIPERHSEPDVLEEEVDEIGDFAEEPAPSKNGKAPKTKKLTADELDKIFALKKGSKIEKACFAPKIKRQVLDNGLTVLYMPNRGTGSVAVAGYVPGGNYYEHKNKHGLADAVCEMLCRGSEGLTKQELSQIFKEMGVLEGLNFRADAYAVNFGSTVVSEDLALYLKTVSRVLLQPLFAEDELAKLKLEWSARLTEQQNNTGPMAENYLYRALYPAEHLFHQIDFDSQHLQLQSYSQADLRALHKNCYNPHQAIITIVGDVDYEQALRLVEESFGNWQGEKCAEIQIPVVKLPEKATRIEVPMPDKLSMDILIGHPLPIKRTDPDFYALNLANLALGGDTIIARLGKIIREQHGLTYGVYSGLGDNTHGMAPWLISLSVNPANAKKALQLVGDILEDYCKKGISADELKREAGGSAGLFTVGLRSSISIARILTRFEALGLGAEAVDTHVSKIMAVRKSDVDTAIRKYLHPDKMVTVMAGTF
ncbi:MAG: insulinase family protein [Candidatus Obscuribacterales bacterium]|nr:insulinase family protein [Candidatus Obscuribacterales bacterium]